MNNIVAHMLCNLTSSMRFEGSVNVDLNEISVNMVPYPYMHFLGTALSPLYSLMDVKLDPRSVDSIFTDCFDPAFQLLSCNYKSGL